MEPLDSEREHGQLERLSFLNTLLKVFYRLKIALSKVPLLYSLVTFFSSFALVFVLWEALAAAKIYPDYLFPSPFQVISRGIETALNREIFIHIWASMLRLGLGFIVGFVTAIPLGILIGTNRSASNFLIPLLTFFQAIPGLAWIPLAILWLGIGNAAVTFIIFNSVFFPILFNTIMGIRSIPENMINAALTLGAPSWTLVLEVYIPGALPSIVTGIRLGVGYGWRALIGGEMIATSTGLGFLIFDARQYLATDVVILGMIWIGVLWLAIDSLFLKPLEKRTILKWGTVRE